MRISFEVYQDDQLFVRLDSEGLQRLQTILGRLERLHQVRLFSPTWGGTDLTEEAPAADRTVVHHVQFSLAELGDPSVGPKPS